MLHLRLTTEKFLINEIGVSDSIHRKKISLRCSDIILFGIPDGKFIEKLKEKYNTRYLNRFLSCLDKYIKYTH